MCFTKILRVSIFLLALQAKVIWFMRLLYLSLFVLCFVVSIFTRTAFCAPVIGPPVTDPDHPGAKITLELDKPVYFLGENIFIHYHVENTSDKPFKVSFGGDYRGSLRALRYHVITRDADGNVMPDPFPEQPCFGGLGMTPQVTKTKEVWNGFQLMYYSRIDKPGTYTIEVMHDLGWSKADPFFKKPTGPTATITVNLLMPTQEQAETVVADMDINKNSGDTWGDRRHPFADYSALRYPVYLPILVKRAASHNKTSYETAIDGIENIPTPEATQTLVTLLNDPDLSRATYAANALSNRLPDGEYRFPEWQYLSATSWRNEYSPTARTAIMPLIKSNNKDSIIAAAYVLQRVGTANDLSVIESAFDHLFSSNDITGTADSQWTGETLAAAAAHFIKMKAYVSTTPKTLGERIAYAIWINQLSAKERPKGWQKELRRIFETKNEKLSSLILKLLRSNAEKEIKLAKIAQPYLSDLLISSDNNVQFYAADWAGIIKSPQLKQALMAAIKKTTRRSNNIFLIQDLFNCGGRWDVLYYLADSMHDTASLSDAYEGFMAIIKTQSYSVNSNQDTATINDLRKNWLAFLTSHKSEIEKGQIYEKYSPEIKDLFSGKIVTFY